MIGTSPTLLLSSQHDETLHTRCAPPVWAWKRNTHKGSKSIIKQSSSLFKKSYSSDEITRPALVSGFIAPSSDVCQKSFREWADVSSGRLLKREEKKKRTLPWLSRGLLKLKVYLGATQSPDILDLKVVTSNFFERSSGYAKFKTTMRTLRPAILLFFPTSPLSVNVNPLTIMRTLSSHHRLSRKNETDSVSQWDD